MSSTFAHVFAKDFVSGCNFMYQGMIYKVIVVEKFYDADFYVDKVQVMCKEYKVDMNKVYTKNLDPTFNIFVFGLKDVFYIPYMLSEDS